MDDDIGSSAPDQDLPTTADETNQSQVDESIEILFQNAIQEFGFAPRDVYDGIFNLFRSGRTTPLPWSNSLIPS